MEKYKETVFVWIGNLHFHRNQDISHKNIFLVFSSCTASWLSLSHKGTESETNDPTFSAHCKTISPNRSQTHSEKCQLEWFISSLESLASNRYGRMKRNNDILAFIMLSTMLLNDRGIFYLAVHEYPFFNKKDIHEKLLFFCFQ